MKRRPYARFAAAFFAVLFVSLVMLPQGADAQVQASTGTISGTVVEQSNGLPISGVAVALYQGDRSAQTTSTDSKGSFGFAKIAPGFYHLTVSANGYARAQTDDFAVLGAADT
ncbi:MAG: carboxypeptidase regulatory-like domain-containing protein, partial [Candidatus Eremiobacteraeota bacterium]|nr:carboxypeptidase regulatory-like domain-containing protein [Candidatus Eremiobacteraeota bacterium]